MARGIKRSLVRPSKPEQSDQSDAGAAIEDATPAAFKRATSGAGSAWKAGAVAQAQAGLDEAREQLAKDILSGDHVLEIHPDMISDSIGTDRRDDWKDQDDFSTFVKSIEEHGQDMPIHVWPEDPSWTPDALEPTNLERVQFLLLAGRRRTEAARLLKRPVKAIIASQKNREGAESLFEMLAFRFRENEEREDLSAFERLLSIGEMYEALSQASDTKLKAKEFAERINVHESIVSRARSVLASKDQILNAFKNVYEMSFHELQRALASLTETTTKSAKKKPVKLKVTKKVGSRNLALETADGKLSVKTTGVKLTKSQLDGLGDLIAEYLNTNGSS
jgi:ParB family chromosome partitioning protein